MAFGADPRQNPLLAVLPDTVLGRWLPQLDFLDVPLGRVFHESGSPLALVYFPTSSIVSLLYVMEDGVSAEIGQVGLGAWSANRCSWEAKRRPGAR